MIQSIIDGMAAAIRTEYDKSFQIYTESVEQGLTEPCFSILCLNGTNEAQLGERRNRTYLFNVTYFPASDDPIVECLKVLEVLYDIFDIIDIGQGKLRGTGMTGNVVDGVLQFQVTYAPFLLVGTTGTTMEEIEVRTDGNY